MELSQIRYFLDVYQIGSLSKAAEKLNISQQGLSAAIRRLEKELNCDLFIRTSAGLLLTETGEKFRHEAEQIMLHVNRIYEKCNNNESGSQRIKLACTINMITRIPEKLQYLLLRGTEDIEIDFSENWTQDCEQQVYDEDISMAIVYGESDPEKFDIINLDVLKQTFIVNRTNPLAKYDEISIDQLAGVPMVIPPKRCRPGVTVRKLFADAGVPLNVAYSCDRPGQIISLVKSNPDFAARIIVDDVSEEDLSKIKVLQLKGNPFLLPICLIWKKNRKLTLRERYFQRLVLDCFGPAE